jgi:hypothetical protein
MLLQLAAQERAAGEAGSDEDLIRQLYMAWLSRPYPLESQESHSLVNACRNTGAASGSYAWLSFVPPDMLAIATQIAQQDFKQYRQRAHRGFYTCDVSRLSLVVRSSLPWPSYRLFDCD